MSMYIQYGHFLATSKFENQKCNSMLLLIMVYMLALVCEIPNHVSFTTAKSIYVFNYFIWIPKNKIDLKK